MSGKTERPMGGVETPSLEVGPGVYPSVPMVEYHDWDAASNGRLNYFMRSPAHMKAYVENAQIETPAMMFGRAAHAAILEPDKFAAEYDAVSQCVAETKQGSRCKKNGKLFKAGDGPICSIHALELDGKEVDESITLVPVDDYRNCLAMRDAIHRMTRANGLITGDGEIELSIRWDDPETGVPCKARWDRHSPSIAGGAIVDLKTTRDASPRTFERAIFQYGYHRQGAFYLRSAKAHGLPHQHYVIIAVEKEPPHGVCVYRLTEGAIDAGDCQLEPLLRRYAECLEADVWPCYPDEVQDIALPHWAWSQIEEDSQ